MGTITSDGGTYTIIKHQQVNQPSIQGTTTFWQYLAIRNSPRSSGTITFSNFVSAWASHGHEPRHDELPDHGDRGLGRR